LNYLAHFHLAWPHEGLLAGALEGDFHKGVLRGALPHDLERGIKLHRAIDAYTDQHPDLLELRALFPKKLRRYCGILIDLSFDHYLSLGWQRYCEVPLDQFNVQVLDVLTQRRSQLSAGSQHMLARLLQYDILERYQHWETVPATAQRVGERLLRGNPFIDVEGHLTPVRADLEQAFTLFYPKLQKFVKNRE